MGNKGVISEEEQRRLAAFWVYCQPVDLYSSLAARLSQNPAILNRTLCYHREAAQSPDNVSGREGLLQLNLHGRCSTPVSVLAALCHRTATQEFVPLSCTLLHLSAGDQAAAASRLAPATASLALPLPAMHGSTCDMALLFVSLEAHPDLRLLKPQQGARITSRLRPRRAFGLVPDGAEVSWGYVPVAGQVPAAQQLLDLGEVLLRRGNMHVSAVQRDSHAAAAGSLCCTFTARTGQQSLQGLRVEVRREHAASVLPHRTDSKVRVFYQYFYHNDERHVVEKVVGYRCSFCEMACRSLTGLQQHLEATHDLFVYGFARDHPDIIPTVNVHVAPDVYNSRNEFVQLDIEAYRLPANKEFFFACSRGQRAARVQQYEQQPEAEQAPPVRDATARRTKLPPFRTALREPIARMSSIDDSTASEPQLAVAMPAVPARRKGSRMQPAQLPRQPRTQYFHSRACIPMTREEVEGGYDSDDEPDTEAWQRRMREQLKDLPDLQETEKEFALNWNSMTDKKPIYGDLFLPGRVKEFAQEHAKVIAARAQLRECFVNFLMILWDYCLLSSEEVDFCCTLLSAAYRQRG